MRDSESLNPSSNFKALKSRLISSAKLESKYLEQMSLVKGSLIKCQVLNSLANDSFILVFRSSTPIVCANMDEILE